MMIACTATPKNSRSDDEPSDFRTAKSRMRCSAETYMSAATMMEATIHISMRELSIDEIASSIACTVSSRTSSELSTTRPSGGDSGEPLVTMVVSMSAPWNATCWASSMDKYTFGVPPRSESPVTFPTIWISWPARSIESPTSTPSRSSATASPGPSAAAPSTMSGGAPKPPSR